jgi:hypothetical protein
MTGPGCDAVSFLRSCGPGRVPFRPCCAAAIVHAAQAPECAAPPCPRLLQAAVVGDALVPLSPAGIARQSEVIP